MTTAPVFPAGREPVDVAAAAVGLATAAPLWLWVTGIDGDPGGTFTACLPDAGRAGDGTPGPRAFGGDVIIGLGVPGPSGGLDPTTVTVTVHAVVAGHLVRVVTLEPAAEADWPEKARPAVAATMAVLAAVEHHANLGQTVPVSLGDPAGAATAAG
ncbi:MAG TPA: hypothetical protein VGI96_01260 [Streptosporangiaceae bacterium]|jgi:hypothetical protein